MSHVAQAQIDLELYKLEASIKVCNDKLSKLNKEAQKEIKKHFDIDIFDIEKYKNSDNSYEQYYKIITNIKKVNSMLSYVDEFIAYNFELDIKEYNEQVSKYIVSFIKNDSKILEDALKGVQSNIKRKYILDLFSSKKYTKTDQLLEDVEDKLKDSSLYKEELVKENLEKLSKIKNTEIKDVKEVSNVDKKITDNQISYIVRNRVLKSIMNIIKEQGFIVKKENLMQKDQETYLKAYKPGGEEVQFKINLEGKFAYKFHKYEGLSCEKDMKRFEELFQNVYGYKLKDKAITWSNPDRLGKMAYQTYKKIGG